MSSGSTIAADCGKELGRTTPSTIHYDKKLDRRSNAEKRSLAMRLIFFWKNFSSYAITPRAKSKYRNTNLQKGIWLSFDDHMVIDFEPVDKFLCSSQRLASRNGWNCLKPHPHCLQVNTKNVPLN
jgi:hypothetical protein